MSMFTLPLSSELLASSSSLSYFFCSFLACAARKWDSCVTCVVPAVLPQRYGRHHQYPSGEAAGQAGIVMHRGQFHRGNLKLPMCQISNRQPPRELLLSLSRRLLSSPGRHRSRPGLMKGYTQQLHWWLLRIHRSLLLMSSRMLNGMPQEAKGNEGENSEGHEAARQDSAVAQATSPAPSAQAISCDEDTFLCTSMTCSTHWDRQGRAITTDRPPRPRSPREGSLPRSRSGSPAGSLVSLDSMRYREGSLSSTAKRIISRIHARHTDYQKDMREKLEEDTRVMTRKITNSYESGFRQGVFAVRDQHDSRAIPKLLAPSFISGLGAGLLGVIIGVLLGLILKAL